MRVNPGYTMLYPYSEGKNRIFPRQDLGIG